jgi:hypothetical protein
MPARPVVSDGADVAKLECDGKEICGGALRFHAAVRKAGFSKIWPAPRFDQTLMLEGRLSE